MSVSPPYSSQTFPVNGTPPPREPYARAMSAMVPILFILCGRNIVGHRNHTRRRADCQGRENNLASAGGSLPPIRDLREMECLYEGVKSLPLRRVRGHLGQQGGLRIGSVHLWGNSVAAGAAMLGESAPIMGIAGVGGCLEGRGSIPENLQKPCLLD